MQPNVLHYGPHLALFVEDEDPLLFYRRIIDLSTRHLDINGTLCMEINETFGQEIVHLLKCAHLQEVSLHRDMHGKARWVQAIC